MGNLDKLYIGTNTKMYKNITETEMFLTELNLLTKDISRNDIELFVIPSFTSLYHARKAVPKDRIRIGAQNMHWEERGQFTGEISPLMLKEVEVDIIEIGHSERRHLLKETDFEVNNKVLSALAHGFIALLCIGETEEQKEKGLSDKTLRMQLRIGLDGVKPEQASMVWIAYEPVWAIGVNGKPATSDYASEKHAVIKESLAELFGQDIGFEIPVLYGGSVNNQNASELIGKEYIDGLFIGRSAWEARNFNSIIRDVLPIFCEKKQKNNLSV